MNDSTTRTTAASGDPVPMVKWDQSDDDGAIWAPIGGATFTSVTALGTVTTEPFTLHVLEP